MTPFLRYSGCLAIDDDLDGKLQDPKDQIVDEAERLKPGRTPYAPTAAELEEHRLTHIPYRNWCPWCVRGKALGEQRGRHVGRTHDIPVI